MSARHSENFGWLVHRIIGGAVVVALFAAASSCNRSETAKKKPKPVEIVAITPLPPPPPLLPPPTPEPEKAPEPEDPEELVEEEQVEEAEPEVPGPEEPPDEGLGTSITGNGADGFGLSTRGDGRPGGSGPGGPGTSGARAAFLRGVSTTLQAELKRHPVLGKATYDVTLNVRVSAEGRVLSITPEPSTGDPAIDRILSHDFTGVLLPQPPPSGKPGVVKTRAKSAKPRA
ncbi:hypothetical protein OKA04_21300 [Luteolibacter flavescens]|uniref:TonB C-terminal domain-containing protein n=1 Tax=Luteolibacter flavescens TaxID=1859460 RepID=A0ABT3FUP5_9BACT|nr:hypothetical protein [Luteolibacter flavescens]MCW1887288.1 hypothetical protein [Luteolibacter flavescens]